MSFTHPHQSPHLRTAVLYMVFSLLSSGNRESPITHRKSRFCSGVQLDWSLKIFRSPSPSSPWTLPDPKSPSPIDSFVAFDSNDIVLASVIATASLHLYMSLNCVQHFDSCVFEQRICWNLFLLRKLLVGLDGHFRIVYNSGIIPE